MRPIACESDEKIAADAEVVQHRLGRDRLGPHPRVGERDVLGDVVGRWWQTITMSSSSSTELTVYGSVGFVDDGSTLALDGDLEDVRSVAAACALGVVRVDRPPVDRRDRVLDEARLVEAVGVHGDLHVVEIGDVERARSAPPVWCPSPRAP